MVPEKVPLVNNVDDFTKIHLDRPGGLEI